MVSDVGTNGLVVFDGDDTLWATEHLYDLTLSNVANIVEAAGLPGGEWRALQREFDLRNVLTMGMSASRFPLSSQQALAAVASSQNVDLNSKLVATVVDASKAVFTMRAPLVDGAEETLMALAPHFDLVLLTKGDPLVQQFRVDQSGLARWFDRIEIVPEKNDTVFVGLAEDFGVPVERSWSIGNSLASDIGPAIRAGFNAIWVDAHVWEYEQREHSLSLSSFFSFDHLSLSLDVLLPLVDADTFFL